MKNNKKKRGRCSAVLTPLVSICLFALAISGCSSASKTPVPISVSTSSVESERAVSSFSEGENTIAQAPAQIASTENSVTEATTETPALTQAQTAFDLSSIPAYSGSPYVEVNNNVPYFTDADLTTTSYETYGELDSLGRCTAAVACIGQDLMPTEKRGDIGSVKPTGWHSVKYAGVDGKFLYNRSHLLAYQLTAEDANEKNLITGTRYMNVEGMEPFENMVADYVKETGNHVLYRVTPIFEGSNLLASGVLMEAKSVEDNGAGILFCVYCYNVQPGITIDYATGDSSGPEYIGGSASQNTENTNTTQAQPTLAVQQPQNTDNTTAAYIGNSNSMKFHRPDCTSVSKMSDANKVEFSTRDEAIGAGYEPCQICNP